MGKNHRRKRHRKMHHQHHQHHCCGQIHGSRRKTWITSIVTALSGKEVATTINVITRAVQLYNSLKSGNS